MSKNLSRAVEPFVTSVAVGKDVVPRLSVVNIGRLIDQMVRASSPSDLFQPLPQCMPSLCRWIAQDLNLNLPRRTCHSSMIS